MNTYESYYAQLMNESQSSTQEAHGNIAKSSTHQHLIPNIPYNMNIKSNSKRRLESKREQHQMNHFGDINLQHDLSGEHKENLKPFNHNIEEMNKTNEHKLGVKNGLEQSQLGVGRYECIETSIYEGSLIMHENSHSHSLIEQEQIQEKENNHFKKKRNYQHQRKISAANIPYQFPTHIDLCTHNQQFPTPPLPPLGDTDQQEYENPSPSKRKSIYTQHCSYPQPPIPLRNPHPSNPKNTNPGSTGLKHKQNTNCSPFLKHQTSTETNVTSNDNSQNKSKCSNISQTLSNSYHNSSGTDSLFLECNESLSNLNRHSNTSIPNTDIQDRLPTQHHSQHSQHHSQHSQHSQHSPSSENFNYSQSELNRNRYIPNLNINIPINSHHESNHLSNLSNNSCTASSQSNTLPLIESPPPPPNLNLNNSANTSANYPENDDSLCEANSVISSHTLNYLINREKAYRPDPFYFENKQAQVTWTMRGILLDWIMEVCMEFTIKRETFHYAVNYVDRYLTLVPQIPKIQLQLVGVTAMYLAAKMEVCLIFISLIFNRKYMPLK